MGQKPSHRRARHNATIGASRPRERESSLETRCRPRSRRVRARGSIARSRARTWRLSAGRRNRDARDDDVHGRRARDGGGGREGGDARDDVDGPVTVERSDARTGTERVETRNASARRSRRARGVGDGRELRDSKRALRECRQALRTKKNKSGVVYGVRARPVVGKETVELTRNVVVAAPESTKSTARRRGGTMGRGRSTSRGRWMHVREDVTRRERRCWRSGVARDGRQSQRLSTDTRLAGRRRSRSPTGTIPST